jgi:hypothetical protein
MVEQLLHLPENFGDQPFCRLLVIQCEVIRNGVQIRRCGLGPYQLSHRFIRFLAAA